MSSSNPVIRGNSLYTIVEGPTWEEAEANAVALGGHLVTINDAEEDIFLTSSLGLGFFFGLTDKEQEGDFSWVNGEPLVYTNWYLNYQPDNDKGNQDYGAYHPNFGGAWDDVDNGQTGFSRGIAEIPLAPNNTPNKFSNTHRRCQGRTNHQHQLISHTRCR